MPPDIAGTQQTVTFNTNIAFPGDQWGLPETWTQGQGLNFAEDAGVGTLVWGINGTKQCTPIKGSNTQIAGIVLRSQANPMPVASINVGYSELVPAGYSGAVARKGNFVVLIKESFNVGELINIGDAVFVNDLDGTFAVGVTSEPGYTQTDYQVIINSVYSTITTYPTVVISNTNDFLGN